MLYDENKMMDESNQLSKNINNYNLNSVKV